MGEHWCTMSFKREWSNSRSLQENCCSHQGCSCWWNNGILSKENSAKIKEHQSTKRIKATEFQADANHPKKRIFKIDYAQAYQCELQNETIGVLWTWGSVTLFMCVVYHNSHTKTFIFRTDYKRMDKFSTGLFIKILFSRYILPNDNAQEEIVWSE